MEAFRVCDSGCDVDGCGCGWMESAASRDTSGDVVAPDAIGRSIAARQHLANCEIGILGGIFWVCGLGWLSEMGSRRVALLSSRILRAAKR